MPGKDTAQPAIKDPYAYDPTDVSEPPRTLSGILRRIGPGMILAAADEHSIDVSRSLMLGDKDSDRIELPELKSVIVKSQYSTQDDYDLEHLSDALDLLVPEDS